MGFLVWFAWREVGVEEEGERNETEFKKLASSPIPPPPVSLQILPKLHIRGIVSTLGTHPLAHKVTKNNLDSQKLTGPGDHHLERLGRPHARGQRRAELRRLDEGSRVVDVWAREVAGVDLVVGDWGSVEQGIEGEKEGTPGAEKQR